MLSSLRVLAWRVLDQGRRALLPHHRAAGGLQPNPASQQLQNFGLYRYLHQHQALKKSVGGRPRGRGGGSGTTAGLSSAVPHGGNGSLVGLLGRLGPIVSSAVRRISLVAPRRAGSRRSLYQDTAPLFALVGVTLLGFEEEAAEEGGGQSRKFQGFVTRQEELEAICGNIREAVSRSGWLQDTAPAPTTNTDASPSGHVYSLQDLDLAGVIDKGCNAAVYAARWRNNGGDDSSEDTVSTNSSSEQNLTANEHPLDNNDNATSNNYTTNSNNSRSLFTSLNSSYINLYEGSNATLCDVESSIFTGGNLNSLTGRRVVADDNLLGAVAGLPFHGSTASLQSQVAAAATPSNVARRRLLNSHTSSVTNLSTPKPNLNELSRDDNSAFGGRSHRNSITEDVSKLLSSGAFGGAAVAPRRTVRFAPGTAPPDSNNGHTDTNNVQTNSNNGPTNRTNGPTNSNDSEQPSGLGGSSRAPPVSQFPLAVKLVFNYEAASNAPAILSALYRELIPARALHLDTLYESWRMDFFGDDFSLSLPPHPNVVEMPCAFVDRVPLLQGGLQLYPTALPARLNPDGFGRNMSLFCVMRRYDMSLAEYLTQEPNPSPRTSLLLLTQLLEALQHLQHYNVSHRDLKPDNLLISVSGGGDWSSPLLVLTDFGCSLSAASSGGLTVPFVSREAEPRQGNAALMAPEVKTARPGLLKSVNFSSCDLWAAGALAYQMYGLPNPFLRAGGAVLDSSVYRESQLPGLGRSSAPPVIRRLVGDMLRRRPRQRPTPRVAATICQLALWAPTGWLNRHAMKRPSHQQVMEWLVCLTTKVLYERRGGDGASTDTDYRLVSTLLARVRYVDVCDAIAWNKAF